MKTAEEVFEAAVKAEEAGDSERAIRLYEECSRIDPHHPLPLLRLALLLLTEGQWKQAIRIAHQVTKRWPREYQALCLIGRSYAQLDRWTKAERYFRQAVTIKKTPETLLFLGHALSCLERNDEAEEYFREALKLDPDNDEIHLNLGRVLNAKGQFDLAEQHFRRAIELDRESALAYANLGELLARQKRTEEAVGFLRSAVEHNPEDRWSRAYLAIALWQLRKLKAAEEQYRRLLELCPNESLSYWCYGDFLAEGRLDFLRAEWYLRKAVEMEPNSGITNYFLGKHLFYWDREDEAKEFLTKATRLGHPYARKLLQQLKD